MKKIFTLIAMAFMAVSSFAGDVYSWAFNGSNQFFLNGEETTETLIFTWNSSKHNFNAKFTGASYAGIDFTKGLKMEGATNVSFTNAAAATVTIVQSTWSTNTIKFDGEELAFESAAAGTGCVVHTLKDVPAGTHAITRGSGENGIFYLSVEYTGAVMTQLEAPTVTFDPSTGVVTISGDSKASSIVYTTDGKNPEVGAENTMTYSEPFTVEDGTVITALCVGDNATYINSSATTETVLLQGITVATPEIKSMNGTVAISSASKNAVIQYSIDGGELQTYTKAFTLSADAVVKACATRDGCTSSEYVSENVSVVPSYEGVTVSIIREDSEVESANTISVSDGTNDFTLQISGNTAKNWSSGNPIVYEGTSYGSLKVSNGAQNTLTLPAGYVATKLTLVSYVNAAAATASVSGWQEINGETIEYKDVPMGDFTDSEEYLSNPDVRVFPIAGTNTITFTNKGSQVCFIAIVEMMTSDAYAAGITELTSTKADNAPVYNLAGQKVNKNFKGVVIQNGKKVVIK